MVDPADVQVEPDARVGAPAVGLGLALPSPRAVAIDLGSTRTRVAVGVHPAVAEIVVAAMATRCARLEGHLVAGPAMTNVEPAVDVKPALGVRTHVVVDGVAESVVAMTATVLHAALEGIDRAGAPTALTHPVDWLPERRGALRDAAAVAGLTDIALVPDAEAVAWATSTDLAVDDLLAVHDLGAETFQTSVLRRTPSGFQLVAHPGSGGGVSGRRLDDRLYDHVLAEAAVHDPVFAHHLAAPPDPRWAAAASGLRRAVRRAREQLSTTAEVTIEVPEGPEVVVDRDRFDDLVAADVALARDVMLRAVQRGSHVAGGPVQRHVVTGGCSLQPAISAAVDDALTDAPVVRPDPFHTVVRGALHADLRRSARPVPVPTTPAVTGLSLVPTHVHLPVFGGGGPPPRRPPPSGRKRRSLLAGAIVLAGAALMGAALWQAVDDDGGHAEDLAEAGDAARATHATDAATSVPPTAAPSTRPAATTTGVPPTTAPTVDGYWLVTRRGGVLGFGTDVPPRTDTGAAPSNAEVAGSASGADGLWLVHVDGAVTGLGVAPLPASTSATTSAPFVGIAPTPSGLGYWTVAADGTVIPHGDAPVLQTDPPADLVAPVVAITATPAGTGYWLAAQDGGVFAYGDAPFLDAASDLELNGPIVAIAATPTGAGYWLAAQDGGVFAYGDAPFLDAASDLELNGPIVAIAATPTGAGYWLAAEDGGVFAYGDAPFVSAFPEVEGVVALAPAPAA
jgi:hypothetical protein